MQKYDSNIIGTHLQILIDTPEDCSDIFLAIGEYLLSFEEKFSRFLSGNWLAELNTSRRAILDVDGKNMLSYMLDLASMTDGYFDPTVGKRLTELGYGAQGTMNNEQGIILEKGYGDYRDIQIVGDEVILHGDILLEFGGVGKGYLIDQIRGRLEGLNVRIFDSQSLNTPILQHSNTRYLINFGGDLSGRGGWKVGLESPFASDEIIGMYILDGGYLACSAGTRRKWGNHHHLIDPKTGESAREVVASYVEGDSGMIADAYATTLCVMPWELARETLLKTPEISGVIVRHDGAIFQKEGSRSEVFG